MIEEKHSGRKISTKFCEDGDLVEFEVEGQASDFISEDEDKQESDSESDMNEEEIADENNNAIAAEGNERSFLEEGEFSESVEEDEEVTIKQKQNTEEVTGSEKREMQKFVDYIKSQGLVIVDSAQLNQLQKQTKTNTAKKDSGKELINYDKSGDGMSEVTVYRNAIDKMSMNRDSSSSDEQLDTSDELDKIPMNDLNVSQRNNQIDKFIADV